MIICVISNRKPGGASPGFLNRLIYTLSFEMWQATLFDTMVISVVITMSFFVCMTRKLRLSKGRGHMDVDIWKLFDW